MISPVVAIMGWLAAVCLGLYIRSTYAQWQLSFWLVGLLLIVAGCLFVGGVMGVAVMQERLKRAGLWEHLCQHLDNEKMKVEKRT